MLLTVQYKGDAVDVGHAIYLSVVSESGPTTAWETTTDWYNAGANSDTWTNVLTDFPITLEDEYSSPGVPFRVYLNTEAAATSTYGDVKFIFKVTKKES